LGWWLLLVGLGCGGSAVVDGGLAQTRCQRACARVGSCLAEPSSCVARCDAIPISCEQEKARFLDCTSEAADGDCGYDASCADEVSRLMRCAGRDGIDRGSCQGDVSECYCAWPDPNADDVTYACVGSGCSCYSAEGFLGSCNSTTSCGAAADNCCAQLQTLAGLADTTRRRQP
jgi:hypothetical protein